MPDEPPAHPARPRQRRIANAATASAGRPHRRRRIAAAAIATAIAGSLLAGCGEDGDPRQPTPQPEPGPRAATSTEDGARPQPGASLQSPPARLRPPLRGGERVVFIGDSLPVATPPTYADRLGAELADRAPGVEVSNLAEPGTTSADWLPGSERFENALEPELAAADVVVVTVGGNDLEAELGGSDGLDALSRAGSIEALEGFVAVRNELEDALTRTFRRIRALAPQARVVYVSYPDYSGSRAWRRRGGRLGALALRLGLGELLEAAEAARPDAVLDMIAVTGRRDVDALLADPEYLGPAGHRLYARRLARTLAG